MPTITLHWQDSAGPRQANVVCEDSAPQALLPLLIAGCGLPTQTPDGHAVRYLLRTARPGRSALNPTRPLSAQHIHDGAQLWLVAADAPIVSAGGAPTRCLVSMADGRAEVAAPPSGLTLDRGWLLRALELLDPPAYVRETTMLTKRRSPLIYVSSRSHCRIGPTDAGGWYVLTDRADVATFLNDAPLAPGAPRMLVDGDRIRLGDAGPVLNIVLF